jgi:hypothetical protein
MAEPSSHQPFADRLLAQETRVSQPQLDAHRRKLDERLAQAARRERRMRAVILSMLVVVVLGGLASLVTSSLYPRLFPPGVLLDRVADTTGVVIAAVFLAFALMCLICLIPFLLLYFLQYRRKLQQIQQEQILHVLAELQRQVAELRERLPPGAD